MLTSYLVSEIYKMSNLRPPYVALLLWITLRARNVFVNGLFNDCFEMLFVYLAIYLLLKKRYTASLFCFSAAASVKMSALLYAPGAVFVFLSQIGIQRTLISAIPGVLLQVILPLPFLLTYPTAYITKSFEFTRNFHWFLSHTWKWLPRPVFESRAFHISLVFAHLLMLGVLAHRKGWFDGQNLAERGQQVFCIFLCNFVGVAFARSLHYSFYIWYFHTLPLLLVYQAGRLRVWHLVALIAVEICWNQWKPYNEFDLTNSCPERRTTFVLTCLHFALLAYFLGIKKESALLPTSKGD